MHSSLNRAQGVFGFFTTVALFVAGVAALSVLFFPADNVMSKVEVKNVQVYVFPFFRAFRHATQYADECDVGSKDARITTRVKRRSMHRCGLIWMLVRLVPFFFPWFQRTLSDHGLRSHSPLQLEHKTALRLRLRLLLLLREALLLLKPALRVHHLGYHHRSPRIPVLV